MSTQHTPSPWRYDYEPGYCGEIIASNGKTICTFVGEPLSSNARLVAAAPDLLEALRGFIDGAEAMGWNTDKARAAIAKASALDDCARAHNSVADERDALKDAARLALDALERSHADAYLDQPAIAALKAVL